MKKILVGLALVSTIGFANPELCLYNAKQGLLYADKSIEYSDIGDMKQYCYNAKLSMDYTIEAKITCKSNPAFEQLIGGMDSYLKTTSKTYKKICK